MPNLSSDWEDEDAKGSESSAKKERNVFQMVDMLQKKIKLLETIAERRNHGLAEDVNAHSQFTSQMVQKPVLESEVRTTHRGTLSSLKSSTTTTHAYSMERLFGSDVLGYSAQGAGASSGGPRKPKTLESRRQQAERKKIEGRKAHRVEIERTLQSNLESFVTRSVESVHFQINEPPPNFDMKPRLLLSYAAERINIPSADRLFKFYALNGISCRIFTCTYWFIHCYFFQANSGPQQRHLLQQVSGLYVKLLNQLRSHKDFFFRYYPYALASAVCWGFHYLCPGSRHLYSSAFKRQVYIQCAQLMTGMQMCPISVQLQRFQLFPDEADDDKLVDLTGGGGSSAGAEDDDDDEDGSRPNSTSTSRRPSTAGSEHEEKPRRRLSKTLSDPAPLDKFLEPLPLDTVPPEKPLPRQQRRMFNAAQVSPLVQHYLKHPSQNAGRQGYTLKRTVPKPWCTVGGQDTFRRMPSRRDMHDKLKKDHEKRVVSYKRKMRKGQAALGQQLAGIEDDCESVLSGSMDLSRFCLDLVQRVESRRNGNKPRKLDPLMPGRANPQRTANAWQIARQFIEDVQAAVEARKRREARAAKRAEKVAQEKAAAEAAAAALLKAEALKAEAAADDAADFGLPASASAPVLRTILSTGSPTAAAASASGGTPGPPTTAGTPLAAATPAGSPPPSE